jgi:hypothetical protein
MPWRPPSVVLGAARPECRNLTDAARRRGARAGGQAVKHQADEAYADLRDFLAALRSAFSYQQTADTLNMRGERTRRGKPWTDVAVLRACGRLDTGPATPSVSGAASR